MSYDSKIIKNVLANPISVQGCNDCAIACEGYCKGLCADGCTGACSGSCEDTCTFVCAVTCSHHAGSGIF